MTTNTKGTENLPAVSRERHLPPEVLADIEERKVRNMVVQQIRGTMWGKDLNDNSVRAIAEYCRHAGIDAVRHVEILGGRLYLTADFYAERGAALIRNGTICPDEPDIISADPRLDELAKGDGEVAEWAQIERERRMKARIMHGAPESAKAVVVQRFRVHGDENRTIIGVNWCGAVGGKRDPVGDAEPTKTAITRAARRAWKQVAEVVVAYAETVKPIEEKIGDLEVVEEVPPARPRSPKALVGQGSPDAEVNEDGRKIVPSETPDAEPEERSVYGDDLFSPSAEDAL